jgi:NitT/TauT family transport system substrate-binding protein
MIARRLLLALILPLAMLCAPVRAADRITVSQYGVIVESLPWAVALEEGFFKQQGLDIDGFVGGNGGGTTIRNMMANASLPFAEVAVPAAIAGIDAGLDLKFIYGGVNNMGDLAWVVKKDSPVRTINDLRGKKVAFTAPRSTTEMVLRMILEKTKLDKDVTIAAAGGIGAGMTALDAGGVDAAPFEEPAFLPPDKYRIVFRVNDYLPNLVWQVGIVSADYAKAHPDVIRKIVAARKSALAFMSAHPDEAAKVYAKVWNGADPRFNDVLLRLLKARYWATDGFNRAGLDTMLRGMTIVGALDHPVDVNTLIAPEFQPRR